MWYHSCSYFSNPPEWGFGEVFQTCPGSFKTSTRHIGNRALKAYLESDNGQMCKTLWETFNCSAETIWQHLDQFGKRYKVGQRVRLWHESARDWLWLRKRQMQNACFFAVASGEGSDSVHCAYLWWELKSGFFTILHGTLLSLVRTTWTPAFKQPKPPLHKHKIMLCLVECSGYRASQTAATWSGNQYNCVISVIATSTWKTKTSELRACESQSCYSVTGQREVTY